MVIDEKVIIETDVLKIMYDGRLNLKYNVAANSGIDKGDRMLLSRACRPGLSVDLIALLPDRSGLGAHAGSGAHQRRGCCCGKGWVCNLPRCAAGTCTT